MRIDFYKSLHDVDINSSLCSPHHVIVPNKDRWIDVDTSIRNQLRDKHKKLQEELLTNFNHPMHNFNARLIQGEISAGGAFPFICRLKVNPNVSHFTEKISLFSRKARVYVECPSFSGNVYFQCNDPDPREVLDILRYVGYSSMIANDSAATQNIHYNECRNYGCFI